MNPRGESAGTTATRPAAPGRDARRWLPLLVVLAAWAVLALPNAGFRSLYYEEGRHAMATHAILAQGEWLRPDVLGNAYIEKPPLLYWFAAGTAVLGGGVNEWTMRLPAMLSVLATALLVTAALLPLVRPMLAATGGVALMLTPMVAEKIAVAEPDTLVMLFSFAAWLLWLGARDGGAPWRLVAAGAALALAGMAKHPTALGYVGAGGVALLLIERRGAAQWLRLATVGAIGLAPVLIWFAAIRTPGDVELLRRLMRLVEPPPGYALRQLLLLGEMVVTSLPWVAAAVPALVPAWRRRLGMPDAPARAFACYALACPLVVVFWPMTAPRYAIPSEPAVAVLAMLALDRLWDRRWVRAAARAALAVMAAALLAYRVVVLPLDAERMLASRLAGEEVNRIAARYARPVLVFGYVNNYNPAWYVRPLPRHLLAAEPSAIPRPSLLLIAPYQFDHLARSLPDLQAERRFPHLGGLVLARLPAR